MADNVLETIQKLVQDVIAPDVRELKARMDGLERRIDDRFKASEQHIDDRFAVVDQKFAAMDQKLASMDQKIEFQIGKVLAAISALRSEGELAAVRDISALRERVAVLETQQKSTERAA
ncbi:hypothetical protein [Terriglobus sp.]|uniref:hypothetical protein n=1 Tax=Terriglobus sp. TaxID=1889013 RepID=UPI003B007FEF